MGPGCDTNCPGRPDIDVLGFEIPVVIKNLDSLVFPVADVNRTIGIHRDRVHSMELARLRSPGPPRLEEFTIFIELRHPGVVIPIGDKNISGSIPGHIRRSPETIAGRARTRSSSAWTASRTRGYRCCPR